MRCEARTLDDIRALGGNDAADERRFATAARVSEINLALYRTFAQPVVRALVNPPLAEWMQQMHPLRLQYELFSNANPMMAPVAALAEQVRNEPQARRRRQSICCDAGERIPPDCRGARRMARHERGLAERTFLAVYGSPALQAAVGIDPAGDESVAARPPRIRLHRELAAEADRRLKARISVGGLREAVIRGAHLCRAWRGRAIDERGFEAGSPHPPGARRHAACRTSRRWCASNSTCC